MRQGWPMAIMGLMTVVRVLPDDLYDRVMNSDEPVAAGAIFEEIVRRYGKPAMYQAPKPMMHEGHGGHKGHGGEMPKGHEAHGGGSMQHEMPHDGRDGSMPQGPHTDH